ncbi:MAG: ferrous iron transport protein A [Peptococcaceae bacterium]|jgi:ferrous iron transport protein A|nr:ferrous iron transport protein A [Peptococcaceae bacterium]MBQ2035569.1 ferrous iron transport protein A [Peptococcaceae bacterium]MBQ2448590.1 ferrous iron transport protein A [Peptococcaceae bacterium]MBQ5682867.1 ferrous iron transport protein A [Peptococcaceae bacterium]MBQ5702144.1 ferrous iron transport protein A [Peptococcaceae bacterium]
MPLTMAPFGEERLILKITGRDTVQKHLSNLGFVPGGSVTVISELGGNMILKVKEARIALDKAMAGRILV